MLVDMIGVPFVDKGDTLKGCDCFGLVRLYYKDILNRKVFKPQSSAFNSKSVLREFLEETSRNWIQVQEPKINDVVAMAHDPKHPKIVQHFGIYLGNGKMLHTLEKVGSHIVRISDYKYYIKGYYRWQK